MWTRRVEKIDARSARPFARIVVDVVPARACARAHSSEWYRAVSGKSHRRNYACSILLGLVTRPRVGGVGATPPRNVGVGIAEGPCPCPCPCPCRSAPARTATRWALDGQVHCHLKEENLQIVAQRRRIGTIRIKQTVTVRRTVTSRVTVRPVATPQPRPIAGGPALTGVGSLIRLQLAPPSHLGETDPDQGFRPAGRSPHLDRR